MRTGTMNLRDIIVIEIYKVHHDPCVWEGRYEVITWLLIKKYIFINSIKLFQTDVRHMTMERRVLYFN